jgi:hypothetical protein
VRDPHGAFREEWRCRLQRAGFSDDGERLRGPVAWTHPELGPVMARIEIETGPEFPIAQPAVRVLDAGAPLTAMFHMGTEGASPTRSGILCLWENSFTLQEAPWCWPTDLIERIRKWLHESATGWPNDDVCDLDRYLEPEAATAPMVLYDDAELARLSSVAVRTLRSGDGCRATVTAEVRKLGARRPSRKDTGLTWITGLGEVTRPFHQWSELAALLGPESPTVKRNIRLGQIERVLLRYSRNGHDGILVVRARVRDGAIGLRACEAADTSTATRSLRSGSVALVADLRIAVVGCGAIGSFVSDLLHRAGVGQLTLIDGERLRPGNLVRHWLSETYVGWNKATAIKAELSRRTNASTKVDACNCHLITHKYASFLIRDHDVVIDATADLRAGGLLMAAAEVAGREAGHVVVQVCVQRDGSVLRIDRYPLRDGEQHLPGLQAESTPRAVCETGCGNPVSLTPPSAVFAAAALCVRVALDEGLRDRSHPASVADVLQGQVEQPFQLRGYVEGERSGGPEAAHR